ncbi:MAG: SsrA-binding protein SmpB [Planctomycetota bacterium]|nr:SsrA-binding protein SmpB [Planctomycetota bacterium]
MSGEKVVAQNKKARHTYQIVETFEAGIVLLGPEVKSIREGRASIAEAFAHFRDGELWIKDMHVPEYRNIGYAPHDPHRQRKLLMHRRELRKLESTLSEKGLTLIPLRLYFKEGNCKLELGLARGRRRHDKRQSIREGEAKRDMERARRRGSRGR